MVIQFPRVTLMFCLKVISTCNLTLIFKFHISSTFHHIYSTNCKLKVLKVMKGLLTKMHQSINMIIMVIQFPRVTLSSL